jgi:hypothetical protein
VSQAGTFPAVRTLGYGCSTRAARNATPLDGRLYCRTVFFINRRTGRLETFFTSAARYSEGHGVRLGMPTAAAERRLRKRLVEGCEENMYLSSTTADLTIAFSRGTFRRPSLHVTGGHVHAFVPHSHADAGVFDCM